MTGQTRTLALVALWAAASGCATVRSTWLSPEWEPLDKDRVKRLVIVTQPWPSESEAVAELWSRIAAKRVDLKRNFIVLRAGSESAPGPLDVGAACASGEEVQAEGALWLRPQVVKQGEGVEAKVEARLFRCVDQAEVWNTFAAGSWPSKDEKLAQTAAEYASELGPEVEPYVVASYYLLNATLDTLPDPVLTEEDEEHKIEYTQ